MRILVVHNQLWAHYKSILFEEIQAIISQEFPSSEFLVAQIALYEESRASMAIENISSEYNYNFKVLFNKSLESVTFRARLVSLFKLFSTYKPDVLNITGYFDYAQVLILFYAKFLGVKTVISSESSAIDKKRSRFREILKKVILAQADGFFCFGTTSVDYLLALGIPREKIMVTKAAVVDNARIIRNYSLALNRQDSKRLKNFIYVGRLASEKNLFYLLNAFAQFCRSVGTNEQWGLHIIGEGALRAELKQYCSANALTNISFTGGVTWQEVPKLLALADVLILPSISEPWGLVVNEAMLCGMPVIVSNKCGCAKDLVQSGENGFLIDPYSVASLHAAMLFYAQKPEMIHMHGNKSKVLVEGFSPKNVARKMVNSFFNLVQKK